MRSFINKRGLSLCLSALAVISLASWLTMDSGSAASTKTTNQVRTTTVAKNQPLRTRTKPVDQNYNRAVRGSQVINRTAGYGFRKRPTNRGQGIPLRGMYEDRVHYTRMAKNKQGTFVKTQKGWLNYNSFYQWYLAKGKVNVKVKLHSAPLYNRPARTKNARKVATVKSLGLLNRWAKANNVAYTNQHDVYYRFKHAKNQFWIPANRVSFDLQALVGHNRRLERALKVGEKLIGHSKYYEVGDGYAPSIKRFDCSEFVRWVFMHAGIHIGPNTFTQVNDGHHVKASRMKRGDIFFFDDKDQGRLCHVGIYLGHHLFLHDSPDTNTGGVGVSSLQDPFWRVRFDRIVRRVI